MLGRFQPRKEAVCCPARTRARRSTTYVVAPFAALPRLVGALRGKQEGLGRNDGEVAFLEGSARDGSGQAWSQRVSLTLILLIASQFLPSPSSHFTAFLATALSRHGFPLPLRRLPTERPPR